ncbi:aspartic peptidase domain-containing protein [Lipomyces kononenkoae]|uniref:Aspartic peptidase domain-containing protein n=1 Tax=Lipomyces kononenkoae TaxID=34357 RepID=A0ACC3STH2_LIPKO
MKGGIICIAGVASSIASVSAVTSFAAPDQGPRNNCMLQLEFERVKCSEAGRVRHRNVVPVALYNYQDVAYMTTISLGTPAQTLQVQLDPGSSDLLVYAATDRFCTSGRASCQESGTFDATNSTTFLQLQNDSVADYYVDTTIASGTYAADTLEIGNVTIQHFIFGYVEDSNSTLAVLGVSFLSELTSQTKYPNLPYRLKQDGIIDLVAYSIWLNDIEASTGSIAFGGIDTGKFTGELSVIPMYVEYYSTYNVTLTGITVSSSGNTNDEIIVYGNADAIVSGGSTIYMVLDASTSLGTLPRPILTGIVNALGISNSAHFQEQYGFYRVDCTFMTSDAVVVFQFGGKASITVTMDQFIEILGADSFGNNVCGIALQSSQSLDTNSESYIAGNTILRSAYVVYDLESYAIGLAQASFNSSITNLFSLSSSGIPDGLKGTGSTNSKKISALSSAITMLKPTSTIASATSASAAPSMPSVSISSNDQRSSTTSVRTAASRSPVPIAAGHPPSNASALIAASTRSVSMGSGHPSLNTGAAAASASPVPRASGSTSFFFLSTLVVVMTVMFMLGTILI